MTLKINSSGVWREAYVWPDDDPNYEDLDHWENILDRAANQEPVGMAKTTYQMCLGMMRALDPREDDD